LAVNPIRFLFEPLDGEFLAKFDWNAPVFGHSEFPQPGRKLIVSQKAAMCEGIANQDDGWVYRKFLF